MDSASTDNSLPFLTAGLAGIGGQIKSFPEDFLVEELPLYEPSGTGTHTYLQIEKTGITTNSAIAKIARALGVHRHGIGYAGLKDSQAVTRQWLSVEHIDDSSLGQLELPNIRILQVARHGNKLRIGHLAGNRFVIRIRQMSPRQGQQPDAAMLECLCRRVEEIMAVLVKQGVPNYFGQQRFGNRCDNGQLGIALVRGDDELFIDLLLGRGMPGDGQMEFAARNYYDQGDYEQALQHWPGSYVNQRRALGILIRGKSKTKASESVDNHLKKFFISAFQAELFNKVLARRVRESKMDTIMTGDIAWKHENGACFHVTDGPAEQPRCQGFEISPTGPIFGQKMLWPSDMPGQTEKVVLTEAQLGQDNFIGPHTRGSRRPMRFRPRGTKISVSSDGNGSYVELMFELDSGCYATALLREITKTDTNQPA